MDHAPRMKEKLRDLEHLLMSEEAKSNPSKDLIRDLKNQINGLKAQLAGGR